MTTLLAFFASSRTAVVPVTVPVGAAIVTVGAAVQVGVVAVDAGGAAIVTVGAAVHVPVPPKVIPVTTPEATVAVAVTVFGQAEFSVTVGAVVYPVPPLVIVALRRVVAGIVVPVTVATAVLPVVHGPVESLYPSLQVY